MGLFLWKLRRPERISGTNGRGSSKCARSVVSLLLLSAGIASAQTATTVVMPQGPLLPPKFGSWVPAEGANASQPETDARMTAILKEDGLTRSSEEHFASGTRTLDVKAFQFDDATGAYSAFTSLKAPEMKLVAGPARAGSDEAFAGSRYLVRAGVTVLEVEGSTPQPVSAGDLQALASTMPKVGGPKGSAPLLPTYLPARNLNAASIRYALGPAGYEAMGGPLPPGILGFEKAAEVASADYNAAGGKGLLTLLLFPTPQIAGDRGRAIEAALNAEGAGSKGTVKLRREGPMLMLATGGFTPSEAQQLVSGIHLRTELTWNKPVPPEFHVEVRKTASLLMSIAVLSGVLMLAAVLLGLFLGFGRASIRVMLGKPAASEPEFLRLDLRDTRVADSAGQKPAGV